MPVQESNKNKILPPRVIVIFGPTAVGKTEVACKVAETLNGEIISADSRQVYRGMDIGTAKPSLKVRQKISHHLIDILDPDEPFNVAIFKDNALSAIKHICEKGRIPVIVGGSFLYLKALLNDYHLGGVPPSEELRQSWLKQEEASAGWLHRQLQARNLQRAQQLSPNDIPRLLRALEISEMAGLQTSKQTPSPGYPWFLSFGLLTSRAMVYERIHRRVEEMFAMGLVEEVKGLIVRYPPPYPLAFHSPGYREVIDYLEGKISLVEAKECVKTNTRHFAKKQFTWLKQFQFTPLVVEDEASRHSAVNTIVQQWRNFV